MDFLLEHMLPHIEVPDFLNLTSGAPKLSINDKSTSPKPDFNITENHLVTLSMTQRNAFLTILAVLFILSLCGNIGTLYVNFRRKIRPFFRACMISLAVSDLLSTVFFTTTHFTQITAKYVQLWRLGDIMCQLTPFVTTTAILASSMTLVGIALDRYCAVLKAAIGRWRPSVVFCVSCIIAIWVVALGIACPVAFLYHTYRILILPSRSSDTSIRTANAEITTMASAIKMTSSALKYTFGMDSPKHIVLEEGLLVKMCLVYKKDVALYYVIVFTLIFVPCIAAFVWLNLIVAKKIWIRRHPTFTRAHKYKLNNNKKTSKNKSKAQIPSNLEISENTADSIKARPTTPNKNCNCRVSHAASLAMPSSLANGPEKITPQTNAPTYSTKNKTRESRHIRMFTIILIMMGIFMTFRLPAWIFLIMRIYGDYVTKVDWILYFSFGIMNLTSCVLNPLFYTFLAETIQYFMFFKTKLIDEMCGLRACCKRYKERKSEQEQKIKVVYKENGGAEVVQVVPDTTTSTKFLGDCCKCGGMRIAQRYVNRSGVPKVKQAMLLVQDPNTKALFNEQDEGVVCSDASLDAEESSCEIVEEPQIVYTIYPHVLGSDAVVNSEKQNG
ncbi:uncharacterized protein LOC119683139 [Teleopsis dalmanni]|uniref:uncharacterized protein LOC119683139 n=1 Tax=Teleopsis dalmanni TaxID=139649 RepID=UPI0018CF76B3|nr:uncharacterized protein LOC119683139 [Teleopsis dalmanni]